MKLKLSQIFAALAPFAIGLAASIENDQEKEAEAPCPCDACRLATLERRVRDLEHLGRTNAAHENALLEHERQLGICNLNFRETEERLIALERAVGIAAAPPPEDELARRRAQAAAPPQPSAASSPA